MSNEYAMPGRALKQLWCEWIELHSVLEKGMKEEGALEKLPTAPFFSAASNRHRKQILFVGKATDGDWCPDSYGSALRKSRDDAISERLRCNRKFVQSVGNKTAFWALFHRLTGISQEFGLEGGIWSNVAKIGSKKGNPSGLLLSAQADLAERTLRAEVEEYQPELIFFVAGSDAFMSRIILRALNLTSAEAAWSISERAEPEAGVRDVWWRNTTPPVLWTQHPQGKQSRETGYWLTKAKSLVNSH